MFSGIQSLIFGKKHHKHKHDEFMDDKSQVSTENDFVILERRHSDEYDRNLYPNLDPSQPPPSNLPYGISPSLPNLTDPTPAPQTVKEETKVDMLQGVPFVLSAQLLLLDESQNDGFNKIMKSVENIKESGEDSLFEDFNYDFELEHTVSSEFSNS